MVLEQALYQLTVFSFLLIVNFLEILKQLKNMFSKAYNLDFFAFFQFESVKIYFRTNI